MEGVGNKCRGAGNGGNVSDASNNHNGREAVFSEERFRCPVAESLILRMDAAEIEKLEERKSLRETG